MAWRPDDSFLGPGGHRENPGVQKVRQVLRRHGHRDIGDRVLTSQDNDMRAILDDLSRTAGMPPGFQQWQLPLGVGDNHTVLAFMTEADAGAVLPAHSHEADLFRVVVSGSLEFNGVRLSAGDWMFIPRGTTYQYTAAPNPGVRTLHCYGPKI
jgi:quercetin dioxygenase-like cupin family protein